MNLDDLLRSELTVPIRDQGFSDQVMLRLPRKGRLQMLFGTDAMLVLLGLAWASVGNQDRSGTVLVKVQALLGHALAWGESAFGGSSVSLIALLAGVFWLWDSEAALA